MSRSALTLGSPPALARSTTDRNCCRTLPALRSQAEPLPRTATQIVSTFSRSSPSLFEVEGCTHPRRPAGRVSAVWKKREISTHLCIRKAREEQTPTPAIGTARMPESCPAPSSFQYTGFVGFNYRRRGGPGRQRRTSFARALVYSAALFCKGTNLLVPRCFEGHEFTLFALF